MAEPREPFVWTPKWLELSGLPSLVGSKVKQGLGWSLFRLIVELDCERNRQPDVVEISLTGLGERLGVDGPTVRKAVLVLRKLRLLACFLPETDEEPALLKVRTPLATPKSPEELCALYPADFLPEMYFRYAEAVEEPGGVEEQPEQLQEIVDLYFNTVGLKMNSFILDELRLLTERFGRDEIRAVFRRASRNEIRSLSWIVGQLARARTLQAAKKKSPSEDRHDD